MAEFRAAVGDEAAYLEDLLDRGLLVRTGVPGIYGRGPVFEQVMWAFDALVTRMAQPDGAEDLRFPPVMPRVQMEQHGYLKSFPHLAGTIFSFEGDEQQATEMHECAGRHEDWSGHQSMSDLVMSPAACYAVYPAIAARGVMPAGGVTVDTGGAWVFRREPSGDPARLQMFHMREIVRIAEPETILAWRDSWFPRAQEVLEMAGLDAGVEVASDPFFGRPGRMMAIDQKNQELKFELVTPIASPEPTAVGSLNYHEAHFGDVFDLEIEGGGPVHTACTAFGLDRITLALLRKHGLEPQDWPADVRAYLWP